MTVRLIVLCIMVAAWAAAERPESRAQTVRVQVEEVAAREVPETVEIVGTVKPRISADVASKVMAAVMEIRVKTGDPVKKKDVLAILDDRESRAEFVRARADFERSRSLLEKKATSQAEFDAARARYRVARAQLSDMTIRSPFEGIVAQKFCEVGDLATPGKPLFLIEKISDYRLEANVPDRFSGAVQPGSELRVFVDATSERCKALVEEIVPASDPSSRSFIIKAGLQCAGRLNSGMFARAEINVGHRTGYFVPASAVVERGQLTFLYVSRDQRAVMRLVRTGKTLDGIIEILAGLNEHDVVILNAADIQADGQSIEHGKL